MYMYSKTSNIGYLKIGTQYINLSTMNTLYGSNNLFCYRSNIFEPSRRGQPLYIIKLVSLFGDFTVHDLNPFV